jgi:hypothetical protein
MMMEEICSLILEQHQEKCFQNRKARAVDTWNMKITDFECKRYVHTEQMRFTRTVVVVLICFGF